MAPKGTSMRALAAALAAAGFAAAQDSLTLQVCTSGVPSEQFTRTNGAVIDGLGRCLTSADNVVVAADCAGDKTQQWTFLPDGTVASGADSSLCWNVDAGETAINTTIILYACGSKHSSSSSVSIAANDVFAYLSASQHILANESGLCLSTKPLPPPVPGQCSSDLDCALNGVCLASGKCQCKAPWTGSPDCGALSFKPAPLERGYGWNPAKNVTSWGGSPAYWPGDGLYHLFVAEMVNGCDLNYWGRNSQISHAIASTPLGPFTFSDVSVPVWAHNPAIVVQHFPSNGSTLWALFHIGGGNGGNPANCTGGARGYEAEVDAGSAAAHVSSGAVGSTLHVSWNGPYGPWEPVVPSPPACNNPAPWLLPNGTYAMVCNGAQLYTAPSAFGPWTQVATIRIGAGVPGTYEDPYLWTDASSNWHVIFHVYNTGNDSTDCDAGHLGAIVAGHAFSRDGLTWHASPTQPYTNFVALEDGTQQQLSTRERPKMLWNGTTPTHLFNGVCYGATTCPPVPCVNCKYNFADATNVVELALD